MWCGKPHKYGQQWHVVPHHKSWIPNKERDQISWFFKIGGLKLRKIK
jgi:hypothetical protein